MYVDVLLDPFGVDWPTFAHAAAAAEAAGFDGVWTYDHLAGSVHGASSVLECWTALTALAATVPRVVIGSMVLNVANRDAGTLGVMAATLQHISGGRLLLGIGAGGGRETPYASEQYALGRTVEGDGARRRAVERAIATFREVWTGQTGGASGFVRPDPAPPVIVGGFGPKMSRLAGRSADGINLPASRNLPDLLAVALEARAGAGRDSEPFLVTASSVLSDEWLARDGDAHVRVAAMGVHRVVLYVRPPYRELIRLAAH